MTRYLIPCNELLIFCTLTSGLFCPIIVTRTYVRVKWVYFFGIVKSTVKERVNTRSDYINDEAFKLILMAMMPENRLALQVSLATGLRISDVLSLKSEKLRKERFTIKEMKTGKSKRVRLPNELMDEMLRISGRYYVFEHRTDQLKHRTRQAVYKDLKRACDCFRVSGVQISPHTARKIYSVGLFEKTDSVAKVQRALNHSNRKTTEIYTDADVVTAKATKRRKVKLPNNKNI